MKSKIIKGLILIFTIYLILKTGSDISKIFNAFKKIEKTKAEVLVLEKKKNELLQKKEYYQSEEFIEQEARNKLNMAKPGEIVVILPPDFQKFLRKNNNELSKNIPSWRQWWQLFFN
ncbi:MAG: FtsB family cell division protein [Microgenomates group bacterium]